MKLDVEEMVRVAKAKVDAMTHEEREAMYRAHARSWVRGLTARCEHGVLDFEQCPKCRGWE